MLKVVVLGAGSHSREFHGPALKALHDERPGRLELAAVCDLDRSRAEQYARDFGFARVYADLAGMLRDEKPSAVVAVTPMAATLSVAGQILRAGVPVLIEKPPGLDSREAAELADVARKTGTLHMVSFNRRFSPAVLAAKRWLAERTASRPVRLVSARMLRHNRREENFVAHTGIHLTDTVLSFTGPPRSVAAWKTAATNPASHICEAYLEFDSGAAAECLFASAVGMLEETYDFFGEDYRIRVECLSGAVDAWESGKSVYSWRPDLEDSPVLVNGTLEETRVFLEAVESARTTTAPGETGSTKAGAIRPRPNLDDALGSFRVAETIQAASL